MLLCSLFIHTSSYASHYVAYRSGFGDFAGICAGALIGTLIGNSIHDHRQAKVARFDNANRQYAYELTRDYNPQYHNEFVTCVSNSCLPEHEKMILIGNFNERRMQWLGAQPTYVYPAYPAAFIPVHPY